MKFNLIFAILVSIILGSFASNCSNIEICPKFNKCKVCGASDAIIKKGYRSVNSETLDIESLSESSLNESLNEYTSLLDHENDDKSLIIVPVTNNGIMPFKNIYIAIVAFLSGVFSLLLFPDGRVVLGLLVLSHICTLIMFYLIKLLY